MKNKSGKFAILLLMVSVGLSMEAHGWDWFGGLALLVGAVALIKR